MFQSKIVVSPKSKEEFLYFISSHVHLSFLFFGPKNPFTDLFVYFPIYLFIEKGSC